MNSIIANKISTWVLCGLLGASVTGCAPNKHKKALEHKITVNIKEPARIRFSGKGAGAGMMLMSSMGPMGIAIGVAIDEGIAKDIQTALTAVEANLQQFLDKTVNIKCAAQFPGGAVMELERVEFKSIPGGDLAALFILGRVDVMGEIIDLSTLGGDVERKGYELEQLKRDGALVAEAVEGEVGRLCM